MQKNKDDIAKKNFRIHLLIRKFSLLWAIFVIAGCNSSNYEVHGRYVDYNCSPVVGKKILIRGSSPAIIGYSISGAQSVTDAGGNFSGVVLGSSGLRIIPWHELEKNWGGGKETRFFYGNELQQLRSEMSKENPIIIYREPKLRRKDLSRRRLSQSIILPSPSRGASANSLWYEFPYYASSSGSISSSDNNKAHLKIEFKRIQKSEESLVQATFSGVNGGLKALPLDQFPFLEDIPVEGYDRSIAFKFKKGDIGAPAIKKALYLSADHGRVYATIIVNLRVVSNEVAIANRLADGDSLYYLVGKMTIDMLFVDHHHFYSDSRPAITNPYLQQKKCGGPVANNPNGYHEKAPVLPTKPDAHMIATADKLREKDLAYDWGEQAKQPETSVAWLLKPEHLHNHWVALEMLKRNHLDDRVANGMLEYYTSDDVGVSKGSKVLQAMSAARSLSPNLYHKLANIASEQFITLARNINLPQTVLQDMIKAHMSKKHGVHVLRAIAANSALSEKSVDMLADSMDEQVLWLVASHKNASPELLTKLSQHSDLKIKKEVAWNLRTPSNVLQRMSELGNNDINSNIANNPNIPTSILEEFAKSSNFYISIYCNPKTPVALRKSIYDSKTISLYFSDLIYHKCWKNERSKHWKR